MTTTLAQLRGTPWLHFAYALTWAGLMHLGCSGGKVDNSGTSVGGNGNVGTGGMGTGGGTSAVCFSPTQNLGIAYQPGAIGCACNSVTDASVCVQGVALVCSSNVWIAVEDGPCMPTPGMGGTSGVGTSSIGTGGVGTGGSGTGGAASPAKSCGARAGNTCSASEYCAYKEGEICGRGDAESVCTARPQVCGDVYAPVCGCDRITYSNSCLAAMAGTGVYQSGSCSN